MSSARLNVPIPEQLDDFVGELIASGLYANKSEYIRHLIREDYKKNREIYPEMAKKSRSRREKTSA